MKISVETAKCIAAGNCVMQSPDVFDQRDEDGVVILLEEEPAEDLHASVRAAAAACPAMVIHLDESRATGA